MSIRVERKKLGYVVAGKDIPITSLKDRDLLLSFDENKALSDFIESEKRLKIQSTIK